MTHLVFVYGSLKRNQGNHSLLSGSDYLGDFDTREPVFDMIGLGYFPAVLNGGDSYIRGELYEVDDDTLERLDCLEGHPRFYERQQTGVADTTTGLDSHVAWIYILQGNRQRSSKGVEKIYDNRRNPVLTWRR